MVELKVQDLSADDQGLITFTGIISGWSRPDILTVRFSDVDSIQSTIKDEIYTITLRMKNGNVIIIQRDYTPTEYKSLVEKILTF